MLVNARGNAVDRFRGFEEIKDAINKMSPVNCGSNRSKTSAGFSSGVPNTEKRMKARRRRRSAFIVSRWLEPLMKNEARVFELASQTSLKI